MALTDKVRLFSFAFIVIAISFIDGFNSYFDKTTPMTSTCWMICYDLDLFMTLTDMWIPLHKQAFTFIYICAMLGQNLSQIFEKPC